LTTQPVNQWWSQRMNDRLTELWKEKTSEGKDAHTMQAIADIMGLSKNAVVGKAHRLNLPPRPSPIRRDGVRSKRKRYVKRAPLITMPKLSVLTIGNPAEVGSLPDATHVAPSAPPLGSGQVKPCEFPMWPHNARPTHQYCGRSASGSPCYCAEHRALCCNVATAKSPLVSEFDLRLRG